MLLLLFLLHPQFLMLVIQILSSVMHSFIMSHQLFISRTLKSSSMVIRYFLLHSSFGLQLGHQIFHCFLNRLKIHPLKLQFFELGPATAAQIPFSTVFFSQFNRYRFGQNLTPLERTRYQQHARYILTQIIAFIHLQLLSSNNKGAHRPLRLASNMSNYYLQHFKTVI